MNVAVIGANGQLGTDVVEQFGRAGHRVSGFTHEDLDICAINSIRQALVTMEPAIIVNTAAMHNVEKCEAEPLRAYDVNALGTRNLATAAEELGAKLVHVSTDYVFDGAKRSPYTEEDPAAPLNVYGNTKLAGEAFLSQLAGKNFVVRTSALYGKRPCRGKGGRNFIDLMRKLAVERDEIRVVDSEFVSPTSTEELAKQIVVLSQTDEYGLYHATAEGSCSWHECARLVLGAMGAEKKLKIAAPEEFPTKIRRPGYSVLENARLKKHSLNIFSDWKEGVRNYLLSKEHREVRTSSVH